MIFRQLFDPASSTFTYLVADEPSREAVLVDPVADRVGSDYLPLLATLGLRLVWVLDTHVHPGATSAAGALHAATGARTARHEATTAADVDLRLRDGDVLHAGTIPIRVLHTPGHTPCHVALVVAGDRVLTGDALLVGGCGRAEWPHGDPGQLWDSVTHRLFTLPDATRVFPGHDQRGGPVSTIGVERTANPRFLSRTRAAFIREMTAPGQPAHAPRFAHDHADAATP